MRRPHYLYPHSLANKSVMDEAQKFWKNFWRKCKPSDLWEVDTSEEVDSGNTIFSAYNATDKVSFRVIQFDPPAESADFECWVSQVRGNPDIVEELVIAIAPTTENTIKAREIVAKWVAE